MTFTPRDNTGCWIIVGTYHHTGQTCGDALATLPPRRYYVIGATKNIREEYGQWSCEIKSVTLCIAGLSFRCQARSHSKRIRVAFDTTMGNRAAQQACYSATCFTRYSFAPTSKPRPCRAVRRNILKRATPRPCSNQSTGPRGVGTLG